MRKLFIILPLLTILCSCAALAPGADPLVVRTEQAQTVAAKTFDLPLHIDQADRGFWRTNAPAFHQFCEWLRQPVPYSHGFTTTHMQRCLAMQANVDDLKLAYKASKSQDNANALSSALATLAAALTQASSWSAIITNSPHLALP